MSRRLLLAILVLIGVAVPLGYIGCSPTSEPESDMQLKAGWQRLVDVEVRRGMIDRTELCGPVCRCYVGPAFAGADAGDRLRCALLLRNLFPEATTILLCDRDGRLLARYHPESGSLDIADTP